MGEHLRKRRTQAGRTQKEIAALIGVNEWTYLLWEADRTLPTVRYYPPIFQFLGYDPLAAGDTLGSRLVAKRRELGLTIAAAAKLAGVDEGTFGHWERGKWKPRMSADAIHRFLSL